MEAVGVTDISRITHRVLDFEDQILPTYDHILVDEAPRRFELEMTILKKLSKNGPNDLFLVGDVAWTVLPKFLSLKDAGINVLSGSHFTLQLNYETQRNFQSII